MKIWNLEGKTLQTKLSRFTIFVLVLILYLSGCTPKNKEQLKYSGTYAEQDISTNSEAEKNTAIPTEKLTGIRENTTPSPAGTSENTKQSSSGTSENTKPQPSGISENTVPSSSGTVGDTKPQPSGISENTVPSSSDTVGDTKSQPTGEPAAVNNIPKETAADTPKAGTTANDNAALHDNAVNPDTLSGISDNVHNKTESGTSRVTLLAVGDNLIHSQIINSGKQKDGSRNYDFLYANLKDEISAADIAVINQETIFAGGSYKYSGYPKFNSPVEIGDALVNAGFDVVLHATNHAMDMGQSAVFNTINYWKGKPGITVLGINESKKTRSEIPIIEKNGIKIAMLNYTYSLNGYELPKDKPYLVNLLDKGQMEKDIKRAKELADFVIVFPHWGTEYVYEAAKSQKDLTKFFYDQGVDLVIGAHPHVLEPVEWIETEPGHKMLVYYSLGNFLSYQKEAPRMLGGIAGITITKDSKGTYISDAGITPIVTHYEIGPTNYNLGIYKLTDYTSVQAMAHGVSKLAVNGGFTYESTYQLAKKILGSWFE